MMEPTQREYRHARRCQRYQIQSALANHRDKADARNGAAQAGQPHDHRRPVGADGYAVDFENLHQVRAHRVYSGEVDNEKGQSEQIERLQIAFAHQFTCLGPAQRGLQMRADGLRAHAIRARARCTAELLQRIEFRLHRLGRYPAAQPLQRF